MSQEAVKKGLFANPGQRELAGPKEADDAPRAEKKFYRDGRRCLKLQGCWHKEKG